MDIAKDVCPLCRDTGWIEGKIYDDGSYVTSRRCPRRCPDEEGVTFQDWMPD